MSDTKIDIFEKNAEFFELFCNSQDTATRDRYNRIRDTIYGIQVKIDGIVTNGALTEAALINKSVGSGKWMREGAGGWCTTASQKVPIDHDLNNRLESGVYALYAGLSNTPVWQASGDALLTFGWGSTRYIDLVFGTGGKIAISGTRNGRKSNWYDLYTQENTSHDKHNVLHAGTGTPLDTLNTSDITDTVIDSEDSVPSNSAVMRALFGAAQKWVDVTSQREINKEYVNNTGKPIIVIIETSATNWHIRTYMTIDAVRVPFSSSRYNEWTTAIGSIVVPVGSTYTFSGSFQKIENWSELRN